MSSDAPQPADGSTSPPPPAGGSPGTATRVPQLRSVSDPPAPANPASHPLGPTSAARRGGGAPYAAGGGLPANLQARMQAFQQSRMKAPPPAPPNLQGQPTMMRGFPSAPGGSVTGRPTPQHNWNSAPVINRGTSLSERRGGLKLPGAGSPMSPVAPAGNMMKNRNRPHPGSLNSGSGIGDSVGTQGTLFDKYAKYVDPKTGSITFDGKAVLHGKGVEFSSGTSISMSLDEIETLEELGKGNYGTVHKVLHRPSKPRRGSTTSLSGDSPEEPEPQGRIMAMKEIRLELDENKFAQIIMELDVLHRCRSPYIIEFYGAFFQEGAVYICMENMDGGSIDKIYHDGVPEPILKKIAYATVMGLKTLKEDHNIIHRDVKPTNILVNTRGDIKLCDFGVSGNLVASIAKTNIGCQSYMAPERIATGGSNLGSGPSGTYGVQSDVWSLGLSLLECAKGRYPYPPETYNNIFSQLTAIVDGDPPTLPENFSDLSQDFVRKCLSKVPNERPTYAQLLQHPWIADLAMPATISEDLGAEEAAEQGEDITGNFNETLRGDKEVAAWVQEALQKHRQRIERGESLPEKPALHKAPLDAVSPSVESGMKQMGLGA